MFGRVFSVFSSVLLLGACADVKDKADKLGSEEQGTTATTQTSSFSSALTSDSTDLGGYAIEGIEPSTATVFHLVVDAHAKWVATVNTNLSWDSDKVRQGQVLDVTRSASATGKLKVLWTISGTIRPFDAFDVHIDPIPLSLDVDSCNPNLTSPPDGGAPTYDCTASAGVTLFQTPGLPLSPYVKLNMNVKLTVAQNDAKVTRAFVFGTAPDPSTDLQLSADERGDQKAMPCDIPDGTDVQYVLDPVEWQPSSQISVQQPSFSIGEMDPVVGLFELPAEFDAPFGPKVQTTPAFDLIGAGTTTDFGGLQPNNVLPTVNSVGPFSGIEGSPVQFAATTHSACPITSYVWTFSNGTTSFGATPQRAFGDDGVYSGELVVTDSTHLSGAGDFSVTIANAPPVPNAGPDTSGAWGTPIVLHGQAVDPGSDDQATLTYSWDFGDGTPGAGGAVAAHAYMFPGDYAATFTACDDHVCVPSTTHVHIRARATAVAFTGTNTGVYSATAPLSGSIVDELGMPVVGGTLAFTLAGNAAGSAQTDSTGNAVTTQTIVLPVGSYATTATFSGTALYVGAATGGTFSVARMASTLTYTGALSAKANKGASMGAKLVDSLGRPLAGKLVVFQLGTQQTQAVTDLNGVASGSIKVTQHNGSYPLTATWTPTGGDADRWTASSQALTFVIGS